MPKITKISLNLLKLHMQSFFPDTVYIIQHENNTKIKRIAYANLFQNSSKTYLISQARMQSVPKNDHHHHHHHHHLVQHLSGLPTYTSQCRGCSVRGATDVRIAYAIAMLTPFFRTN